jgi:hypothetical protein
MTLVLNEIHTRDGFKDTLMVAATDRRISNLDGTYNSTRKKLFKIEYLNGAVSYFGVASTSSGVPLSDWLPRFITRTANATDLRTFATRLKNEISQVIPKHILRKHPSGFHICGYQKNGLPDFWSLSNTRSIEQFKYNCQDHYKKPSSDFLGRDAKACFGWDGNNPGSAKSNRVQIYRNGDFRAHAIAWINLNFIFNELRKFPDFNRPRNPKQYGESVKSKFEIIAYIYKKWAKQKIIARPIDVFVILPPKDGKSDIITLV